MLHEKSEQPYNLRERRTTLLSRRLPNWTNVTTLRVFCTKTVISSFFIFHSFYIQCCVCQLVFLHEYMIWWWYDMFRYSNEIMGHPGRRNGEFGRSKKSWFPANKWPCISEMVQYNVSVRFSEISCQTFSQLRVNIYTRPDYTNFYSIRPI